MKMAANRGILYEQKINKILRREKAQRPKFEPAGSDSNAADAEIRVKGNDYKVEISVRDQKNKTKYFGSDEVWEKAENILIESAKKLGQIGRAHV